MLKDAGYEVTGIMMKIYGGDESTGSTRLRHGCYGPGESEDIEDARKVAETLGIRLEVFDLSQEYQATILEYFEAEYRAGRTPNPCVRCNQTIKLGALIDRAKASGLDFDFVTTGHYARVEYHPQSARYRLLRGLDRGKDQSYFLFRLSQEQLRIVRFPLGDLTKEEVREKAQRFGLTVADKPESQNFVSGGYRQLLGHGSEAGPILDESGRVLGIHPGIASFTIGQRHGLGLIGPEPRYVTAIDAERNAIIVGRRESLFRDVILVVGLNWISIERLDSGRETAAQIRSGAPAAAAWIEPLDTRQTRVTFKEPQVAPAPGQAVVFYEGDVVVGGGTLSNIIP